MLAIGNALALAGGPSVTEGIVSAENRTLSAQNDSGQTENLTGLLQTDAAINPGELGRSAGRLPGPGGRDEHRSGLERARATPRPRTSGSPSPSTRSSPSWPSCVRAAPGGRRRSTPTTVPVNSAYIGVTVGPITPALQQQDHLTPSTGALILSVQTGSPAEKAALQVNDVIVSLNGDPDHQPQRPAHGHPSAEARGPGGPRDLPG